MNSVEQRMRSENKKAEHSKVTLYPRSDQEPLSTMQIGAPGKIMQKRRNLTGHNSPVGYGLNVFYLVGFGRICRKMRTVFN